MEKNIELLRKRRRKAQQPNKAKHQDRVEEDKIKARCPKCQAVYQVGASKIPDKGIYAKCRKCQTRFYISKLPEQKHIPPKNSDLYNYRVPGERKILYISLSCLAFIFFVLLKINFVVVLIVIVISVALVKIRQGQLLGQTVKVSEDQFPKVYKAAKIAATRLSMRIPDVFIKQDPVINAFALGFLGKKSVVLHSKTVESMENDELISILGHEFTHIRCHHTSWIVITNSSEGIRIPILTDIMGLFFRAWSRKAEFTADRGGLLASMNPKASVSALCKITVGEKLYEELDIDKFVKQVKEIDRTAKIAQMLSTHPYTVKRLLALRDYYKSGSYEQLVEKGVPAEPDYVSLLLREIKRGWDESKNQKEMINDIEKLKEEIEDLKERRGKQQN